VADQLRRNLGINVSAYNQEWQSYQQSQRSLDYDLARAGWVGDYEDPNTFLDLWLTNGGNNQTGWSSLVYDRLLEAAADVERFAQAPEFLLEHVRDPEGLKQLLAGVQGEADVPRKLSKMAALRLALLREAERIIVHDELPIMPLYFYVISGMVKPQVKGFYSKLVGADGQERSNLRDQHPLRDIVIDSTLGGHPR
jgi:oligopeptide transport system substrate-binding protein